MGRLAVDGHKSIYYEYFAGGDAARPAVILSHGWGMAGRVWDDTVAALQDAGWPVLTYDHRNCGQSDKDFDAVEIADLGDDIVALCDALNIDGCVLNGWSLGGAVVVDAAAKLGPRAAGLILTGGATPCYTQREGFPHGGTPDDVAGTVAALRAGRVDFLKGLYFEGVFVGPVSDDVKHWCWQIALQASSGADASLGALAHIDQREIMAGLTCPARGHCRRGRWCRSRGYS